MVRIECVVAHGKAADSVQDPPDGTGSEEPKCAGQVVQVAKQALEGVIVVAA